VNKKKPKTLTHTTISDDLVAMLVFPGWFVERNQDLIADAGISLNDYIQWVVNALIYFDPKLLEVYEIWDRGIDLDKWRTIDSAAYEVLKWLRGDK